MTLRNALPESRGIGRIPCLVTKGAVRAIAAGFSVVAAGRRIDLTVFAWFVSLFSAGGSAVRFENQQHE